MGGMKLGETLYVCIHLYHSLIKRRFRQVTEISKTFFMLKKCMCFINFRYYGISETFSPLIKPLCSLVSSTYILQEKIQLLYLNGCSANQ